MAARPHTRPCPELGDESWLRFGVARVLEAVGSGRGFLQEHGPRFTNTPGRTNYFYSPASTRRRDLAIGVNLALIARTATLPACLTGRDSRADLLLLYEDRLENHHRVINTAEDRRREQRTAQLLDWVAAVGRPVSSLLLIARRAT